MEDLEQSEDFLSDFLFPGSFRADVFRDQAEFMANAGMPREACSRFLADFWKRLIDEEHAELGAALAVGSTEEILREAIDVVYVVAGLLNSLNLDGTQAWRRIHEANMAKVSGTIRRRSDGKIMKPDGWRRAELSDLASGALQ